MPPSEQPEFRRHPHRVIFRGNVQGVGFRYTTHRIAKGFNVAGYVKNLRDGTVELVVQGAPDAVDDFLGQVGQTFAENIQGTEATLMETDEIFQGFEIRR